MRKGNRQHSTALLALWYTSSALWGPAEVQDLLQQRWTPPGATLPHTGSTHEVVARLVRMTSGNLRLLTRLLTQVACPAGFRARG